MEYTKSLIQSKTFWFASLKFVAGALTLFSASYGEMIPAGVAGAILMVTSIIDAVLRTGTSTPIGGVFSAKK